MDIYSALEKYNAGLNIDYSKMPGIEAEQQAHKEGRQAKLERIKQSPGEITDKLELSEAGFSKLSMQQISNAARLEEEKNLKSEMAKISAETEKSGGQAGSSLELLAQAYDNLNKNLGENSDSVVNRSEVLDSAFKSMADTLQALEAMGTGGRLAGMLSTKGDKVLVAGDLIKSAKKQSELFSSSFLEAYKNEGMGALGTAMDKLNFR